MSQADIAVIGLAVMGQNLVLNMADNGHSVSVYNRTHKVTEDFVNDRVEDKTIKGFDNYKDLIGSLSIPRKVLILVKAGQPVDSTIEEILPFMDKGDVIIDNGTVPHYCKIKVVKFFNSKDQLDIPRIEETLVNLIEDENVEHF